MTEIILHLILSLSIILNAISIIKLKNEIYNIQKTLGIIISKIGIEELIKEMHKINEKNK